jgi:DNA-directed RNA polymerase subunit F
VAKKTAFLSSAASKQLAQCDERFKQALPEMRKVAAVSAEEAREFRELLQSIRKVLAEMDEWLAQASKEGDDLRPGSGQLKG